MALYNGAEKLSWIRWLSPKKLYNVVQTRFFIAKKLSRFNAIDQKKVVQTLIHAKTQSSFFLVMTAGSVPGKPQYGDALAGIGRSPG